MGNAESVASIGTLPTTDKIKLKNGNKSTCIPSPQKGDVASTYEKIIKNGDFKDFMYQHLDSDYLIDAVLQGVSDDAEGERTLFEGISVLNVANSSDLKNEYIQNINNYQNLVESGINVKIKDSLSCVEKELDVRSTYKSNPFIKSFHKRLAALKSIEDCIINEKMVAIEQKKRRQYAFNHLNSTSHPQLLAIEGLTSTGLHLLQQFPVFYPLLRANTDCLALLTRPIKELCENFISFNDLDLYSAWAPAPKSPMKQIALKKSSATSSSGTAAEAIDNLPTTCWTSSKSRSTWSVQLKEPSSISAIRIAWAPLTLTPAQPKSVGFAPKKITLKIRESNDDSTYTSVLVIDPAVEWKLQGTWNQVYQVNCKNVAAIQVFCAKYCQYNTSTTTKMYDFEVLVDDKDAKWVNTAELLVNLQVSLLPVLNVDMMWSLVLESLLSLIRSSGSLSLTLRLIKYLYEYEDTLDMKVKSNSRTGEQILRLMKAYQTENDKVIESIATSHPSVSKSRNDVMFDALPTAKTSGITLSADNMLAISRSTTASVQYCLFNHCMEKGLWEWEILITEDILNGESTCLGVSKLIITNNNYESSSDMWVVNCVDGELYHGGRSKNDPITSIHPLDVCRFTYDSTALTLSMSVNNIDQGVLFEQVPNCVTPLVLFYGSNNCAKIVSVNYRDNTKREMPPNYDKLATSFPSIDLSAIGSESTIIETLLRCLAALAATRIYQVECALTDTSTPEYLVSLQSLEYPYCIELSIGVIEILTSLLKLFVKDMKKKSNKNMIRCCLQLLDAHFTVLNHTNLDLVDVGLKYKLVEGKIVFETECDAVVRESFRVLQELRQSCDDIDVRVATCKAFARGSSIFLPNGYDKIDLCLSIINESLERNSALDEATSVLLEMLVQTLSQYEQIIKIIEIYEGFEPSRHTIQSLLTYLLSLISDYTIEKLVDTGANAVKVIKHDQFRKTIVTLFVRLQEQLVHYLLSSKQNSAKNAIQELFILYSKKVISAAILVFNAANASTEVNGLAHSIAESYLRDSMIMHILQPLVHSFCFFTSHFSILQGILPSLVFLLQQLSDLCKKSKRCAHLTQLLYSTIPSDVSRPPKVGASGWKTIKAQFEDNQPSYTVSDNGTMYTSAHSNNTCGIVNTPFGKNSRAAWEFQLESDTLNDECSVFGAARLPESPSSLNRCYSTSPDLWMRRAYNGYMYVQGRTTGNNMEKIHPTDIVRIEFDGKAGTLSFSVNGSEPEVGFTDISETIYPACGSYRANVAIKLLKVEVFSSDESDVTDSGSTPKKSQWVIDPERMSSRDPTVLIPIKTDKGSDGDAVDKNSWVTARTADGVSDGVHEWTFEILENSKNPFALGVVSDSPYSMDRLAGPCYDDLSNKGADANSITASSPVAPVPPAGSTATSAPSSIEHTGAIQAVASNDAQPKSSTVQTRKKMFNYPGNFFAVSWNSDGSLWVNGVRRATDFGKKYLPFNPFTSVTIRIDRFEHTISYLVNGELVGVAFGPELSNAKVSVPMSAFQKLYPAASVSTCKQSIKIKQTGFNGSLVLPIQILMQKTCSATIGRLISVLSCGPVVDKQESLLMPWLQSPLLIGGMDDDSKLRADSSTVKAPRGTWDDAWNEFSTFDAPGNLSLKLPTSNASDTPVNLLQEFLNNVAICKGGIADGSDAFFLLNWLENIEKEPLFMRQAMEKIGSYSFPVCEMPILACLLKHSGLVVEAMECCNKLKLNELPTPSPNMVILWKKMKQIRVNLRKERQRFKENITAASIDATNVGANNAAPAANTPVATTDAVPALANRQLDIISAADSRIPMGVFLSEQIAWRTQTPDTISIYSPTYQCTVLAVGIDFVNEYLFIRFCVRGDSSMGDIQSPSESTLHVNDIELDDSDQNIAQETPADSPQEILGTLRYDMSNYPDFATTINSATVQFEFGNGGYIPVILQLPLNSDSTSLRVPSEVSNSVATTTVSVAPDSSPDTTSSSQDDASNVPNSFDEYCSLLESRALFLLNIYPSENYSDSSASTSKDLILDLLDRFTNSVGTPLSSSQSQSIKRNSSFKLVRMKSHDGTERWGRVMEFVKGNSKLRRQLSNSNNPSNGDEITSDNDELAGDETISPVVAAIQACSLFITLTEKYTSSSVLSSVMTKRSDRASYRIFAFDALYTILKYSDITTDPFLLEDQFLFFRQALRDTAAYSKPDAALLNKDHNAHYLVNLEGCNAAMLTRVQESFLKVFSVVSNVTSQYMSAWDTLSMSNCYGCLLTDGDAINDAESIHDTDIQSVQKKLITDIKASNAKVLVPPLRIMLSIWSLNFSTRDCLFLLKCGILSSLQRLTSFATLEKVTQTWYDIAEKLAVVDDANCGNKHGKYCLWSNSYVVEGLKSGTLSCRAVLLHLYLIPHNVLSTSERVTFGLDRNFKDLCINLGVPEVSLLYQRIWLVVQKKNKDIQKDEILKKQKLAEAASKIESEVTIQMAACGSFDPLHSSRRITLSDRNLLATFGNDEDDVACAIATVVYDCDIGSINSGNYFEVEILSESQAEINIGLTDRFSFCADGFTPGLAPGSYSYNALTGARVSPGGVTNGWPASESGDVIGCGFAMDRNAIFFTRNGVLLGDAFTQVRERILQPVVAFNGGSVVESLRINFGVRPFRYTSSEIHVPSAVANVLIAQENVKKNVAMMELEGSMSNDVAMEVADGKQREKYTKYLESCDAYIHEYHSLRRYSITLLKYFTMLACKVNEVNSEDKKSTEEQVVNENKMLPPKLVRGVSTFGTPKKLTSIDGTILEENLIKLLTEYFVVGSRYFLVRPAKLNVSDPDLSISRSINYFHNRAGESTSDDIQYAIEPLEIENCLHETLILLNSVMVPSRMFKRHFLSPSCLNSLLFVLYYGSMRTRRLAINLLMKLLPTLTPDETENMLSDEWKGLISSINVGPQNDSTSRRQRRMPDSIIKLLMCGVRRAVTIQHDGSIAGVFHNICGIDALKEPVLGFLPYGYGHNVLISADQNIALIQKLFASPMWTELIACNITDTLRVARETLELFNAGQNKSLECDIVLNAAAACAVLSGFEIIRQGCKIVTVDNAVGHVVSLDYFNQTVQVVFADSLAANNYGFETISTSKIKPKVEAINVDLSRLSQPLLSNLTGLIKELFLWLSLKGNKLLTVCAMNSTSCKTSISHHTIHSSLNVITRADKCLFRLNSVASASLSYLLEHQGDFCLESVDSTIVQSIIAISLLPTCMTYLPELSDLSKVWNYVQSRKLEQVDIASNEMMLNDSCVITPSSPVAHTVDSHDDKNISREPSNTVDLVPEEADGVRKSDSFLPFSAEDRASRQTVAKSLSSEFGLDESFCLQRLEYFMNDEIATRANLSSVKECENNVCADVVDVSEDNVMLSKVVMSDENPLRSIDDPSIVWDSSGYDNFNVFSDFERELMRILYKDNDVAEGTPSSTLMEYGSLVIESLLEGPNAISSGGKSGRCLHQGEVQSEFVVSLYDESRGLPYCDLVQTSSMRLVNLIYGQKQDSQSVAGFMSQLDLSLTILRTRGIASRLLLDGNVNLSQDADSLDSWVKLLKLITINESSLLKSTDTSNLTTKKGLNNLCNALLTRASSSVVDLSVDVKGNLESSMVDILVNDVVHGFKNLTHSSFTTLTKDTKVRESSFLFASPHPYIAPLVTTGKIDIPSEWRGVLVTFNPKCSTASNLAKLNFYKSEKDYQSGKYLHSFWGDHLSSGGDNSFHSFTLTRETVPKSLYYSFEALPGSEKPVLNMVSSNPSVQVQLSSVKAVTRGARGLGDSDSLFNLFDESDSQCTDSCSIVSYNTIAECDGVTSGVWFFEIIIDAVSTSEDMAAARVGLVNVVNYNNEALQAPAIGSMTDTMALDLCGRFHYMNTGDEEEIIQAPEALGAYTNGDVIGCLFRFSDVNNKVVSVTFAKNGDWANAFSHDVSLPSTCETKYVPGVSVTKNVSLTYNFGSSLFKHPPSVDFLWQPFLARPISTDNTVLAWGYQFSIQPLNDLYMKVNRDFTLITTIKAENGAGTPENENIWIWRSKSPSEFCSCGDIITLSNRPPRGSIIFDKSQCKPASKFIKIFNSSKLNITVWRPQPCPGYVALGDVVTTGSSSPSSDHGYCVPEFAVTKCLVGKRIYCSKKGGETKLSSISIWSVGNQLGTFFASSSDQLLAGVGDDAYGVGNPYMLKYRHLGIISGEWSDELEVLSLPSLSWSFSLLNFLIDNSATRSKALTTTVFSNIIQYIRSNASPAPLQGIPILIKFIRAAQNEGIVLPLDMISGLCSAIMQKAVGKVNTDKGVPVSDSLVRLVDLVVEVNSIQVINSNMNKNNDDVVDIAKIPSFLEKIDEHHKPLALQLLPVQNIQWWDRSSLNPTKLDISRLISADKVESLFTKDPILRRMKQVLNFFAAIGADRFKSPSSAATQSYSYPRLMIAKLWYDNFSNCIVDESAHPYRDLMAKKKISFPSASKLVITFDKRCSIGCNAALIIEYFNNGVAVVETIKGVFGDDPKYVSGLVIPCSEFEVSFTANDEDGRLDGEVNPTNDWGWAYMVTATGPIYECISNALEFNSAMFSGISHYRDSVTSDNALCYMCSEPITKSTFCRSCLLNVRSLGLAKSTDLTEAVGAARAASKEVDKSGDKKIEGEKIVSSSEKVSNEVKGSGKDTCPSTIDAVEDKLLTRYMQDIGVEVKQGTFVVPHAIELEIMIERPNPKTYADANNDTIEMAVIILSQSSDDNSNDSYTQVIKVPTSSDKSVTIVVPGDRFSYSVMALPSNYVSNVVKHIRFQADQLLDEDQTQSESAVKVDVSIDESTKADAKDESLVYMAENTVEDPLMSEFWACNICTCFNPNYMDECSACMNPRSGESPESQAPGAGWWCQHCTFINPLSTSNCSMCSLPRGDDGDAKAHSDDEVETAHESTRFGGGIPGHEPTSPPSHGLTRTDSRSGKNTSSSDLDKGESYEIVQLKKAASNSKSDMLLFTVKGKMNLKGRFETRLEGAVFSDGKIVTPYCIQTDLCKWTPDADNKLLEYINTIVTASTSSSSAIFTKDNIYIPKQYYSFRGSSLLPMSLINVQSRMFLLEAFNKCLEDILPILNTKNSDPYSIGSMVRKFNKYIFMNLKMPLLEKAIAATSVGSGAGFPASLSLDNFKALASRDKEEKDPSTSNCCFVQAFRQLQKRDSAVYRHIFSTDRVFQINFVGESGIDAGGVFREGISRIIEDLFSDNFNLLLLCPNGQHGIHTNLDKYVPNPQHTGPLAMQMFEFMGRLMGMSLRAKLCLPFELPSIIWKGIIGDDITLDDLREVDFLTVGLLEAVRNCEKDNILDQEAFQAKYDDKLRFVYNGSDGVEREIKPGSGSRVVTYENREEFCDAILNNRLREFEKQVLAIERGMSEVISTRILQLFSWQQLEILVAGNPIFDIELWKSKTESHVSPKTLALFWKVMEGFTPKEQAGFIRFAWGRSRLPAPKDFTVKMRLTSAGSSALPQAHTCFFHVELPEYPTEDEMRHGLLTAIHYGVGGILNG